MEWVNAVLLAVGNAVRWAWGGLAHGAGWVGAGLDPVLDVVLSRPLAWLNPWCSTAAAWFYGLLDRWPAWLGLVLISAAAGAVMVGAFRWTSNQQAIRRVRDDIKANLLVLRLFKEDLGVAARAQGRLLWALLRLQGRMLPPIALMILPVMMVMAQMNRRYQHRSLQAGERTLVHLRFSDDRPPPEGLQLEGGPAIDVEIGPIAGGRQVLWRVRAGRPGRHQVAIHLGDRTIHKEIVVGGEQRLVSDRRPARDWIGQLLYPAERPLPRGLWLASVDVDYPLRVSHFAGADWWILWFLVLSLAFGGVAKSVFKVAM